jgi:hypothetical protein
MELHELEERQVNAEGDEVVSPVEREKDEEEYYIRRKTLMVNVGLISKIKFGEDENMQQQVIRNVEALVNRESVNFGVIRQSIKSKKLLLTREEKDELDKKMESEFNNLFKSEDQPEKEINE